MLVVVPHKNRTMTKQAQLRAVDKVIRSAELSGVGLEGTAKERFNEVGGWARVGSGGSGPYSLQMSPLTIAFHDQVQQELSQLSTQFGNNLLDSTKVFAEVFSDKDRSAADPSLDPR